MKCKFCQTLFIFVVLLVAANTPLSAQDAPPLLIPSDENLFISYQLEDKDDVFWAAVRDAARSGRKVMVIHNVKMKKANNIIGGKVQKKVWHKFVTYNLFEDSYGYGENIDELRRTTRKELVKAFVLGIDNKQFIAKGKIKTGKEYKIKIHLEVTEKREEDSWVSYLPFQNLFKQKLLKSFIHVAR